MVVGCQPHAPAAFTPRDIVTGNNIKMNKGIEHTQGEPNFLCACERRVPHSAGSAKGAHTAHFKWHMRSLLYARGGHFQHVLLIVSTVHSIIFYFYPYPNSDRCKTTSTRSVDERCFQGNRRD
jgi:hypothetical protein